MSRVQKSFISWVPVPAARRRDEQKRGKLRAASPRFQPRTVLDHALRLGRVTTLQPNLLRKYSSPAPQSTFLLAGLLPLTQASEEIGDLR